MAQEIEILPSDEHGNARHRFGSFKKLPNPVPLAEQKKSGVTNVSAYARLRVTLDLIEVPAPLRVPLHVTMEGAPEQNGPWSELHALSPLKAPGSVVADVELGSAKWVRASWFWQGPIALEFGISALAFEGTREEPAVQEAPDPLRELSDKELQAAAASAQLRRDELDAAATKVAEELRALNAKLKSAATPNPKLASEALNVEKLAIVARDNYREFYDETASIMRELTRRACVKRLAALRAEVAAVIDCQARGDRLAATFDAFLSEVRAQLGEVHATLAARDGLIDEINSLEKQVGDGAAHKRADVGNHHALIAAAAAEHLKHVYPSRSVSSVVWEVRELLGLALRAQDSAPAQTAAAEAQA